MTRRPHFPWPFPTQNAALRPAPAPAAEVDMEPHDEAQSPYCECDLEPTMQEESTRQCSSCGKALIS